MTLAAAFGTTLLFCIGGTLLILGGVVGFMVLGAVNQHLPVDQQFGYFFSHPSKGIRLTREYRRLYPKGRLEVLRRSLVISGAAFMMAAGLGLGRGWH